MTASTKPRFDEIDLDGMTTTELIELHAELARSRDGATSHPIVNQALALRVYQVESAIAVRNAQVMADLDDAAEQRTVERIAEWLRSGDNVSAALAPAIERGDWRQR